ncbi:MAG: thiamine biosynthesis lipoprotein [Marinoscillum sp.]|jgi:thiamine biosynthesis lipoprotein
MNSKWFFRGVILVVVLGAAYNLYISRSHREMLHLTGTTMGSIVYNVKYIGESPIKHQEAIDSILVAFNQSLSTYIPASEISQLNQTGILKYPSGMFLEVLEKSQMVFDQSKRAFDPTVGPLVNAWGFGPNKILFVPDSAKIDSLLSQTGFSKVVFSNEVIRIDSGMYLDFSAIAKGYAVDLVARFLSSRGYLDYMVEIGGEVRATGLNQDGDIWKLGIEDPTVEQNQQQLLAIVQLNGLSMATSGNYRNYYKVGERIIAHTIDPRTGHNTQHNLLSASVFAKDCMTADAFATAFMVLGLENSKQLLEDSDMEAFLIFSKEDGSIASYVTEGIQPMVTLNKAE